MLQVHIHDVCISGGWVLVCVGSALVKLPFSNVVAPVGPLQLRAPFLVALHPHEHLVCWGEGGGMLVTLVGIVLSYCGFNLHIPGDRWGGEQMRYH